MMPLYKAVSPITNNYFTAGREGRVTYMQQAGQNKTTQEKGKARVGLHPIFFLLLFFLGYGVINQGNQELTT